MWGAGIMKNRPCGAWMRKRDMSSGMFAAFAVTDVDCAERQVNGPNRWMRSMGRSSVFICA